MQNLRMRVMRESDAAAIAALNETAIPAVNSLTEQDVLALLEMCDVAVVATNKEQQILAFLLSLCGGMPYESENYRWFEDRGVRHQYIDRIVVAPGARGTGVGRALYESVFERAREKGANDVTCEVNIDPPNPGSLAFHDRLGFRRLGEQDTKGGTVRVALLARSVY
ncbi:MAG: GNAT family N-acetyltransferase [Actinobacteria bacterium HGW-Actinobacteria-4]|nr:MAG: GNAT family N-acetyltransferase [Actinobacteria bacterium HGW-Actinobacteria-4]